MNRHAIPPIFTAALVAISVFFVVPNVSAQATLSSINTVVGSGSVTAPEGAYVDVYGNIYALTTPTGETTTTAIEIPASGGPVVTLATALASPRGIAADSLGDVYISQVNVGTVLKIAADGTTSKIGSGLERPFLMTVDSSNNLYIANSTPGDVIKIGPSGTQTTIAFTGLTDTHGVAVDSSGNVYTDSFLTTTTTPLIAKMSTTGVQTTLPITGLNDPYGMTVDDSGNLYVIDAGVCSSSSGRLLEFTPPFTSSSQPIVLVCGLGSAAESVVLSPRGDIVYNNTTNVYALQHGAANVYGTPVTSASGVAALTFSFTTGATLGPPVFLSNNAPTAQFKAGTSSTCASGKTIAAGGTCVLDTEFTPLQVGPLAGAVNLVSSTGVLLATVPFTGVGDAPLPAFAPGTQSIVPSSITLETPTGVALDAGGSLYVADTAKDVVTKTTSGGTTTTLGFTGLSRPTGVAVDGYGSVYVSDASNNAIYKLTAAGVQTTVPTTGLNLPKGIALDGLNNLYIADSVNQRIVKIDVPGNQTVMGFTGLTGPAFVAVDAAGDVFVSDTGTVYELPFGSKQITLSPSDLSAAAGIAVDSSGTLYIADSVNDDVLVSPTIGAAFTLASGLHSPAGLVLAANGNLYVANTGSAQVVLLDRTADTLTLPSTAVAATSAAMTVTVQNIGNVALTESPIAVTSGFAQVTPLAATDCGSSISILAASEICNVNITFSPAGLGPNTGTATLTDNALNATAVTQTISLTGTGTQATAVTLALTTPATGNPVYGQTPTVTATVAPTSGTGTPTGIVTFVLDGGAVGTQVALPTTGPAAATYSPLNLTAGNHTVVATYGGDSSNASSSSKFTITVTPAVLAVTANPQTRMYNVANAPLTYSITGYQYSDNSSVLTGAPVLTTTATTTSAPGIYPISITTTGAVSASNYTFIIGAAASITVTQATNTITFPAIADVTYGTLPITPSATASSQLAITYTSLSTNATITSGPAGPAITITGAGAVIIAANQAGNADYSKAAQVTQTFTVAKAPLTVTANNLSKESGQANPTLTYTLSGFVDGDPSSVVTGAPTLSTLAATNSPTGTYPITIGQGSLAATNYTFNSSSFVNGTLTVTGITPQTITFGALPNTIYGSGPISLVAMASSGAPVSYTVAGQGATLSAGVLTITGPGTVTVTAAQVGNSTYAAATPVAQSFTVSPATLTVTAANASRYINTPNPTFTYTITGYVNGDTPGVVSGAPTISTTATTSSSTGTYPITTTTGTLQAAKYVFAFPPATLTVNPAVQTITFATLPGVTYGVSTITLAATTNSSLPITYTVTGPASLNSATSTIAITGAGTVVVTAAQAGNATYAAATPVVQSFVVASAPLTVTASSITIPYGSAIPTTFAYTITGFQYSDTQAVAVGGAPSIATTATANSPGGPYPITPTLGSLTAGNYTFANFIPGTLTISPTAQAISFAALSNIPQTTATLTLNATSTSGLPVVFTETGTAAVTITSNGVLTISGPGTVSVTAFQPGNSSYTAATPVTQTFNVTATSVTTLSLSANTANVGSSVTLTAKITFTKAGTPTGTVSFYDGTTLLSPTSTTSPSAVPITVSGLTATATLTTATVPSGSTDLTAVYTGDTSYTGSSSGATATPILVVAPDFNISATPSLLTISPGQSETSVITVTPVGGYSDTVAFSCPGIPSALSCSFAPPALNFYPGTGTGTLAQTTTLTVSATLAAVQSLTAFRDGRGDEVRFAGTVLALPGLAFSLCFARRRRIRLGRLLSLTLLALAAFGTAVGLTGCGSGAMSPATATYNIPVTMNDGSGVTHVVTVTVNVQ